MAGAEPEDSEYAVRHPSDPARVRARLKRVPPKRRRFSNPVLTPVLRTLHHQDSLLMSHYCFSYTSPQDLQGYAVLRELRRVVELTDESGSPEETPTPNVLLTSLLEGRSPLASSSSPSSRGFGSFRSSHRNPSYTSMQSAEQYYMADTGSVHLSPSAGILRLESTNSSKVQGLQKVPTLPNIRKPKPRSTGAPEFMGICLPVDISMLFQVDEDNSRYAPGGQSFKKSPAGDLSLDEGIDEEQMSTTPPPYREVEGMELHTTQSCLHCQMDLLMPVAEQDHVFSKPSVINTPTVIKDKVTSASGSLSETIAQIGPETEVNSFRQEVLKHIVIMNTGIAHEHAEQHLLSMRQKSPKGFNDICLYSEVCHMLSNYNYRLTARRFIQELFQDAKFTLLTERPDILVAGFGKELSLKIESTTSEILFEYD